MTLRLRLFLFVGVLFVLSIIGSSYLEDFLAKRYLYEGEQLVSKKIAEENEIKRKNFEEFLSELLMETEAKLNAVLKRIELHPDYLDTFKTESTWHGVAELLMTNNWIDFIQNVNENQVSSGVMMRNKYLEDSLFIPIHDELAIYFMRDDAGSFVGPFIGIKLEVNESESKTFDPHFWTLFHPKAIESFTPHKVDLYTRSHKKLSFPPFFSEEKQYNFQKDYLYRLVEAKRFLANHQEVLQTPPETMQAYISRLLRQYQVEIPKPEKQTDFQSVLLHNRERYIEIEMIWNLALIFFTPPSLTTFFGLENPIGVVAQQADASFGRGLLSKEVFFNKQYFNPSPCLKNFSTPPSRLCHDKSMSVVYLPDKDRVFFVNALDLSPKKEGDLSYLAVGVDGAMLLKKVALATHETTVFVTNDKIIEAYDGDGEVLDRAIWGNIAIKGMLENAYGTTRVDGTEYFYLHLKPIKGEDFHFFLFEPKAKAFALVDTLNHSAKTIVSKVSWHMRFATLIALIIVLFFLSRISKRVTHPISVLAKATQSVEKGQYDQIDLPEIKEKRGDEVSTLYHSFREMVQGLKEKEKVRGVLNKVVSPDIAEEILKGGVHLGGEAKIITVLFADIRNFTGIALNMSPDKVIEMLNTCMTKISEVIDEHGGVIDKYVGDEVMALFGAPVSKEESACQAVLCGLDIIHTLSKWNKVRADEGLPAIEMGVGIHTGEMVAGNMGAENRLNYTVLGSNVNLAARLCSVAKPSEILVSEATINDPSVKGKFSSEPIENQTLKGFDEPITVYKIKNY